MIEKNDGYSPPILKKGVDLLIPVMNEPNGTLYLGSNNTHLFFSSDFLITLLEWTNQKQNV